MILNLSFAESTNINSNQSVITKSTDRPEDAGDASRRAVAHNGTSGESTSKFDRKWDSSCIRMPQKRKRIISSEDSEGQTKRIPL